MKDKVIYNNEPSVYQVIEDIKKLEEKYKLLYNKHYIATQYKDTHKRMYILNVELIE